MNNEYRSPLQQIMDQAWAQANSYGSMVNRDTMVRIQEDDDARQRRRLRDDDRRRNAGMDSNDWIEE